MVNWKRQSFNQLMLKDKGIMLGKGLRKFWSMSKVLTYVVSFIYVENFDICGKFWPMSKVLTEVHKANCSTSSDIVNFYTLTLEAFSCWKMAEF
jgi:hypothetical protein